MKRYKYVLKEANRWILAEGTVLAIDTLDAIVKAAANITDMARASAKWSVKSIAIIVREE